jgi:hypothetical protein
VCAPHDTSGSRGAATIDVILASPDAADFSGSLNLLLSITSLFRLCIPCSAVSSPGMFR